MALSYTAAFALLSATVSSVIARRRLWVHQRKQLSFPLAEPKANQFDPVGGPRLLTGFLNHRPGEFSRRPRL